MSLLQKLNEYKDKMATTAVYYEERLHVVYPKFKNIEWIKRKSIWGFSARNNEGEYMMPVFMKEGFIDKIFDEFVDSFSTKNIKGFMMFEGGADIAANLMMSSTTNDERDFSGMRTMFPAFLEACRAPTQQENAELLNVFIASKKYKFVPNEQNEDMFNVIQSIGE